MGLPNIDISPLLEIAWSILQWSIKWTAVLALLVFLAVLVAGAGDILAENLKGFKKGKANTPVSRTKE